MTSRAEAEALDRADPLARFREAFALPEGIIYLDGNSLGPLLKATMPRLKQAVEGEWGSGLIRSWTDAGWMEAPLRLGDKIAPLIGAGPGEVAVTDSTSVNLFKLLVAAVAARPGRGTILTQGDNFPTDLYIAEGAAATTGCALRRVPADEIAEAVDGDVAVVALTHVDYRSGRVHDMAAITAAVRAAGALMLWDLSHSAGALPVDLAGCDVDLAVGCGYKYLNGGPGAPAYLYVASRLQERLQPPLWGWMGHRRPFDFADQYRPAPGIGRFLCGTPPIVALAALESGLDLWREVDMVVVRRKSHALGDRFIALADRHCPDLELLSPRDAERRGSQVSFRHREAEARVTALIERGVIGDFRPPDILRFGLAPLYLRHVDIDDAVAALRAV